MAAGGNRPYSNGTSQRPPHWGNFYFYVIQFLVQNEEFNECESLNYYLFLSTRAAQWAHWDSQVRYSNGWVTSCKVWYAEGGGELLECGARSCKGRRGLPLVPPSVGVGE